MRKAGIGPMALIASLIAGFEIDPRGSFNDHPRHTPVQRRMTIRHQGAKQIQKGKLAALKSREEQ